MKTMIRVAMLGVCVFASMSVMADDTCPAAAQTAMDAKFGTTVNGVPTSAITHCLNVREEIRVAVNVSNGAINGNNSINQQINNVLNMIDNYENIYGLTYGKEGYRIAVVVHGAAGNVLLDDDAYFARTGTHGNTIYNMNAVKTILSKGVKVYMCQNTMKGKQYVTADLIPGVEEVPAGVTASADFGMRGWVVLSP